MECNLKKQSICTKDVLIDNDYNINVENDFTLPDYYPPIKRILSCKIEPTVSSKNISGNIIGIDGVSAVRLLYIDNEDFLNLFESGFVFNKNIDIDLPTAKLKTETSINDTKVSCNVKNERKFEIKGAFELQVKVIKIECTDCLCNENGDNFERLSYKCVTDESILLAEKNIILDEEIELSDSHSQIGKIINYYGKILPDESKIMNGKIMLKGFLSLHITYLSPDNMTSNHIEQKIPYSQVCDIDNINENFICKTDENLVFLEIKCRNSGYDEARSMTVNAKICINIEAALTKESDVILDMFSTDNEINLIRKKIESSELFDTITDIFSAKKTLEFSEGSISSVIDVWSSVKITGVKKNEGGINVFGIVYIKSIFCSVDGTVNYYERAVDFEYKYDFKNNINNYTAEVYMNIDNLNYIIASDSSLEIMSELSVKIKLYKVNNIEVITDIEVGEISEKGNCSSINICYLENETAIWDISKKYKCKENDLKYINNLENDKNSVKGMVIIPAK